MLFFRVVKMMCNIYYNLDINRATVYTINVHILYLAHTTVVGMHLPYCVSVNTEMKEKNGVYPEWGIR